MIAFQSDFIDRSERNEPVRIFVGNDSAISCVLQLFHRATVVAFAIICVLSSGCTQLRPQPMPYRYGTEQTSLLPQDSLLSPPVLIGGPVPVMDRWERLLHKPAEAWDSWRSELANRQILPKSKSRKSTQQDALLAAIAYLEENDLHQVVVEAHHYDPMEQWKRLEANADIHPLWKYTDGIARVCTYSMFPSRLYRTDSYNPYTRTLSINSDNPASAIYEAAKAKDFAKASWPGAYAATRYVPFVPLGQQAIVSNDALHYAKVQDDQRLENSMVVHTYSTLAGSAFLGGSTLVPEVNDIPFVSAPVARITGSATGAIAGQLMTDRNPNSTTRLAEREALDANINANIRR